MEGEGHVCSVQRAAERRTVDGEVLCDVQLYSLGDDAGLDNGFVFEVEGKRWKINLKLCKMLNNSNNSNSLTLASLTTLTANL